MRKMRKDGSKSRVSVMRLMVTLVFERKAKPEMKLFMHS